MRDEQKHKKNVISVSPISICGAVLPPFNNKTKTNEQHKKATKPEEWSTDSECDMVGLGRAECYRAMLG